MKNFDYQIAFDQSVSGLAILDFDGTVIKANRRFHLLFGVDAFSLHGRRFQSIGSAEVGEEIDHALFRMLQDGPSQYQLDYPVPQPDGSTALCRIRVSLLRDDMDRPLYFLTSAEWVAHLDKDADLVGHASQGEAEDALESARLAAEAANRAKSLFLSNMSHELRTPLNAILGFAQLLMIDQREPLVGTQIEYVKDIISGGKHLLSLIDELLDLAKIDVGTLKLEIADVALDKILREAISLVRPLSLDRRMILQCDPGSGPQYILRADALRLKQVLINLLTNAVKYNRKGGSVTVTCDRKPGGILRINVTDMGSGIPQSKYGDLFRPFSRLSSDRHAIEGTGIGLALTKRLIEAMGGRIGFTSELGVGSTFWFELPLAAGNMDAS